MRTLPRLVAAFGLVGLAMGTAACSSSTSDGAFNAENLTADERSAVESDLAEWAESFGVINPPDVEIVRFVPQSEWTNTMVSCLQREGYDATSSDGVSYDVEFGPGLGEAGNLAQYECAAQYPVRPDQTGPLSDEQKEATFDYLTVDLVACLAGEGIVINDVPSKSTFMDGFDQSPPWNPYSQIFSTAISREELEALESACPVNTPAEVLYGS